jgi:hypothetical protein
LLIIAYAMKLPLHAETFGQSSVTNYIDQTQEKLLPEAWSAYVPSKQRHLLVAAE